MDLIGFLVLSQGRRMAYQSVGEKSSLENWKTGKLENWKTGKLENWKTGKLENWKTGKLDLARVSNAVERIVRGLLL